MTVISEGPDALPTRRQAADALSRAGCPFSRATLATRNSVQGLRHLRGMAKAGVTSKPTNRVTASNCGVVLVVVLTGIKGAF